MEGNNKRDIFEYQLNAKAMEKYLVIYTNIKGEEITSEWFYTFVDLQVFMSNLLGHAFTAKSMRFNGHKLTGIINLVANTSDEIWEKI